VNALDVETFILLPGLLMGTGPPTGAVPPGRSQASFSVERFNNPLLVSCVCLSVGLYACLCACARVLQEVLDAEQQKGEQPCLDASRFP
jgi:hypothetical protein